MTDTSQIPEITDAERAVADLLPVGTDSETARRVLGRVPLWFHTFALNAEHGLYTPGVARDHRYRVPFLPASFEGQRVLDVGAFDGFYAYLAEHRGAARVLAVDNEQYVAWVKARWGVELEGGEGFRAIGGLLEPGGRVLVETYGIAGDGRVDQSTIEVKQRGEVYAGDDYVYWGFAAGGLAALGRLAGLPEVEVGATPQMVDGHPRILATLRRPGT